jgi:hypothetical protein
MSAYVFVADLLAASPPLAKALEYSPRPDGHTLSGIEGLSELAAPFAGIKAESIRRRLNLMLAGKQTTVRASFADALLLAVDDPSALRGLHHLYRGERDAREAIDAYADLLEPALDEADRTRLSKSLARFSRDVIEKAGASNTRQPEGSCLRRFRAERLAAAA